MGEALTFLYTYDQNRNQRFTVSPEGRIVEYKYNEFGLLTDTIQYNELMTDDLPVYVADPLDDLSVDIGQAVSFSIPESTFIDLSGDALSISVSLGNGNALPSWLSFDTSTKTFSGIPTSVGAYSILVVAEDSSGATTSDVFRLVVSEDGGSSENRDPSVANISVNGIANTALVLESEVLIGAVSDPDGDSLAVTNVTNATNGSVAYDFANNQLTFSPVEDFTGIASFDYSVSDGRGGLVTNTVFVNFALPTYIGSQGDDVVSGASGNDVIYAFGGNDSITLPGGDIILSMQVKAMTKSQ